MVNLTTAYLYDGSLEGFFTVVFEIYRRKLPPAQIAKENQYQSVLGQRELVVETHRENAERVRKGIIQKASSLALGKIITAFLSPDPKKEDLLFGYIRLALTTGRPILTQIARGVPLAIENLNIAVEREAHLWQGLIRFSQMEGALYYAKFAPKSSVLPLIMPHFADRFSVSPFLIHDLTHKLVGVYDQKNWYLAETDHLNLPAYSQDEALYRKLWQSFFQTIAIKERINPKNQRTQMPLWYRENLTEFMPDLPTPSPLQNLADGVDNLPPHAVFLPGH